MRVVSGGETRAIYSFHGGAVGEYTGFHPGIYFGQNGQRVTVQRQADLQRFDLRPGGVDVDLNPDVIYSTQPAVRTVISFRANNIGQVPLHSFSMGAGGTRERSRDTPLAAMLRNPAPNVTAFEWMNTLVTDRDLYDRYAALIVAQRGGGWSLVRMPPRTWTFDRDGADRPTAIRSATGKVTSLEEVLWMDNYPTAGKTPIECLKDVLVEEAESTAARLDMWRHRARIPGILMRPSTAPEWPDAARDSFRESWQAYARGGKRSGRTPILEDDMTYQEVNAFTSVDAQQIEARRLGLRFVAAFWHVPPVMVGDSEASNYSNVVAFREQLYNDTLGTDFAAISQAVNLRLVPVVAPDGDEFAEFNVGEKMRLAFDQQADVYQKALGTPYMTINEVRKQQNLPPVAGGDEVTIPINVRDPVAVQRLAELRAQHGEWMDQLGAIGMGAPLAGNGALS